jgi:hypothetical protein
MIVVDAQHKDGEARHQPAELTARFNATFSWHIDVEQDGFIANDAAKSQRFIASAGFADVKPEAVERGMERPSYRCIVVNDKKFTLWLTRLDLLAVTV